ncbi:MAG: CBS domain-containing protein [Desulfovibrionaceae bacterium]
MYVGLKMLKRHQFKTLTPDSPVADAERQMLEGRLWMMLVEDNQGKLIGYVNKEDVKEALPSRATTLSKHELNYLLSKLTVEKVMRTDVPVIAPEADIEEAARRLCRDNHAGLAVVDANRSLIGFINRSVMLEVLVEEMGLEQGGSRIVLEVEDRSGVLHEVSGIIKEMGKSIISTGTFYHNNRRIVVIRVQTPDPAPIAKALAAVGYTICGPHTFEAEWC